MSQATELNDDLFEGIITLSELRKVFEAEINAEARIYNLMPSDKPGQTYWSLHTDRAWKVFQSGVRAGLRIAADSQLALASEIVALESSPMQKDYIAPPIQRHAKSLLEAAKKEPTHG